MLNGIKRKSHSIILEMNLRQFITYYITDLIRKKSYQLNRIKMHLR